MVCNVDALLLLCKTAKCAYITRTSPYYSQRCNSFNLFPCFFRAQAPQGASNYVGNILKPLMSLQGEIPANYEQQWRTSIIEMVTGRYNNNNCIIMCKQ